jgi:hypothetical protein
MSHPDFEVTNHDLAIIQLMAERAGHLEAIRQHLKLPPFDTHRIKERAHWHYTNGPSSFYDSYLLERSWILAIGDALRISFRFEIDRWVVTSLPKKPDNP